MVFNSLTVVLLIYLIMSLVLVFIGFVPIHDPSNPSIGGQLGSE